MEENYLVLTGSLSYFFMTEKHVLMGGLFKNFIGSNFSLEILDSQYRVDVVEINKKIFVKSQRENL